MSKKRGHPVQHLGFLRVVFLLVDDIAHWFFFNAAWTAGIPIICAYEVNKRRYFELVAGTY